MSTTKSATFSSMLNEWLVYSNILETTFQSQNWLMENANMVKTWQGGQLIVPVQQAYASSMKMGGLTDTNDIAGALYLRGSLAGYKEAYGSLQFHSRDLYLDHYTISAQNFLKILPDQIDQLMKLFKQSVSIQVLNGTFLDSAGTAFVAATDTWAVAHPDRFMIGQKVVTSDGTTTVTGYVSSINMNSGVCGYVTTRGGATAVDLAGLVAASTHMYIDGGNTTSFNSLRAMLLPAAQGGSDTWASLTKTTAPYMQAIQYDAGGAGGTGDWGTGTAVTGGDMLQLVFDAMRKGYQLGAEPKQFIMSYKNYSACLLALETNSGAFKNIKPNVSYAGYSAIEVGGVAGACELVGIREMQDDWIAGIDKKYLDFFCGNKPWQVMTSPDGLRYYTTRQTDGYLYTTDVCFAGDFLYRNPSSAVAIYNIPNYKFN
jgi:hypothetical protein